MNKKDSEKIFNSFLPLTEKIVGNDITNSSTLRVWGKALFGDKFVGVYPSDRLPNLCRYGSSAIINEMGHGSRGSHWTAISRLSDGEVLVFDSFGRPTVSLLPTVYKKYKTVDTEDDKDQQFYEKNCGAQCLAFIATFIYDESAARWV